MRIVLCIPQERGQEFAEVRRALADLGHHVSVIPLSPGVWEDLSRVETPDVALLQGVETLDVGLILVLASARLRVAAPPLHTLVLLDHPLHWRRVAEREGIPLPPWLWLAAGEDASRDARVSVLGFPLRVSSAHPGSGGGVVAWDREELAMAQAQVRGPDGVLVERQVEGEQVVAFTGLERGRVVLSTPLDEVRARLTCDLAGHVQRIFQLTGPCAIEMVWERSRLMVTRVWIPDLGPSGLAAQSVGVDYPAFLSRLLEAVEVTSPRW